MPLSARFSWCTQRYFCCRSLPIDAFFSFFPSSPPLLQFCTSCQEWHFLKHLYIYIDWFGAGNCSEQIHCCRTQLWVSSKSNTQWRRSKSIIIERLTAENKIKIEESSPHFLQLSTSVTRCLLPSATASFAAAFQKHHCWPGCIANNREQRNGTEGSHCGGWGDTENKFHLPPLIVCRQHRPPPASLSLSLYAPRQASSEMCAYVRLHVCTGARFVKGKGERRWKVGLIGASAAVDLPSAVNHISSFFISLFFLFFLSDQIKQSSSIVIHTAKILLKEYLWNSQLLCCLGSGAKVVCRVQWTSSFIIWKRLLPKSSRRTPSSTCALWYLFLLTRRPCPTRLTTFIAIVLHPSTPPPIQLFFFRYNYCSKIRLD